MRYITKNISKYNHYISLFALFLATIPSGMFAVLSGSTLSFYLKDLSFDNTAIALFALANFLYIFKFLWSPYLEYLVFRCDKNFYDSSFKLVLLISLSCCIVCLYLLSIISPQKQIILFCSCLVGLSFFAASYGILIKSSQILLIDQYEWGIGEAVCIAGFRVGILTSGSFALYLSTFTSWQIVYQMMSCLCLAILLILISLPLKLAIDINYNRKLNESSNFYSSFKQFWQQPDRAILIGFFITYRLQDHLLGKMPSMYLIDIGFSKTSIALVYKAYGFFALLLGGFIGGYLYKKITFKKLSSMLLLIHALCGLSFIALSNKNMIVFYSVITICEFTKGLLITPFFSYQLRCCDPQYAITQIALITSIVALSHVLFGALSGYLATELGWTNFFILTSSSSLICLYCIKYLPNLQK